MVLITILLAKDLGNQICSVYIYMNARSLKKNIYTPGNLPISNLLKFQEVVYSDTLDLICISETWLNSQILNKEILQYGFDIYRADRATERTGRGVLIAINHGSFISSSEVALISTNNLEVIPVQATLPSHSKLLLVCCYRPLDCDDMSDFRSLGDNLFSSYEQVIIAGDFNLPNINWMDSNYTCNGALDLEFCDILDDYFMSKHCLLPTRESNILDLLITNHAEQVSILTFVTQKKWECPLTIVLFVLRFCRLLILPSNQNDLSSTTD